MNTSANYKAIALTGTMGEDVLGNGVTGTSVHQVYCLSSGAVTITAAGGGTFTWNGTSNTFIDVVVKSVTVSSGTFIGFKAKTDPFQFGPFS
tara:strand:+ start:100 stop:375 length:276 start_codon:yes stop_codon:yes gene_type:complete